MKEKLLLGLATGLFVSAITGMATTIPEPVTMLLFGAALLIFAGYRSKISQRN